MLMKSSLTLLHININVAMCKCLRITQLHINPLICNFLMHFLSCLVKGLSKIFSSKSTIFKILSVTTIPRIGKWVLSLTCVHGGTSRHICRRYARSSYYVEYNEQWEWIKPVHLFEWKDFRGNNPTSTFNPHCSWHQSHTNTFLLFIIWSTHQNRLPRL